MNNQILNEQLYKSLIQNKNVFEKIFIENKKTFHKGCGSYLFDGQVYEYNFDMFEKQKLLFEIVKNCDSVLEIGTYMGHSAFIMLLSNPYLKITTIDNDKSLAPKAVQVLENSFSTKINFIYGDSLKVLSELNTKFDLIHIDGSHNEDYVIKEFEVCKKFLKSNIYKVIFDDIESIPNLEKHILSTYKVLKYIKPNCKWNNCYFEIEL